MDKYLTVNTLAELCCLLVALFTLTGDKVRTWRYFSGFLLIALLVELSSIFLRLHGASRTNWVYNIYGIYEIVFVSLMFWQLLKGKVKRWSPFYLALLLIVLAYSWETYLYKLNHRYDLTNSIFGIVVVLSALYYLKLLMADQHYVSLVRDPNFWWIMGTIFFYFAYTSLNLLHSQLMIVPRKYNPLFTFTYQLLNVLLYSLWSYAFICRKWNRTN